MSASVIEKQEAGATLEAAGFLFSSKAGDGEECRDTGQDYEPQDRADDSSTASSSDSKEQDLHERVGSSAAGPAAAAVAGNGWEVMDFDSDEDDDRHSVSVDKDMQQLGSDGGLQEEEEDMPPLVEKTHCIENKNLDHQQQLQLQKQQHQHRRGEVYRMPAAHREEPNDGHILLWPIGFIISSIGFQMKLVGYSFSLAMLLLNISYSLLTEPIHKTVQAKNKVTGKITDGISTISNAHIALWESIYELGPKLNRFISRLGYGVLAAAYICLLMSSLVVPAVLIDIIFISRFVEEPVQSKEGLHFDYTESRPSALVPLFPQSVILPREKPLVEKKSLWIRSIPKSHKFHITVFLRLPESEHNVQLGMFQVTAEIMSVEGIVLARFTQPCMLRYRSRPIRYARTLMVAVPLLLGVEAETQTLVLSLVECYEDHGRNQAGSVRIMLEPRAGFQPGAGLPELYDAEIVLQSKLPTFKSLIYNWKWTFYVWSGIALFLLELTVMLCCCRNALLPSPRSSGAYHHPAAAVAGTTAGDTGSAVMRTRGVRRKKVSFLDDLPRARAAAEGVGTRPSDIENFVQRELEALSGAKEKLCSVQDGSSSSLG